MTKRSRDLISTCDPHQSGPSILDSARTGQPDYLGPCVGSPGSALRNLPRATGLDYGAPLCLKRLDHSGQHSAPSIAVAAS